MKKQVKLGKLVLAGILAILLTGTYAFGASFEVKGVDVQIGGYIKAMLTYDINNVNDNTNAPYQGDIFCPYAVVLDNDSTSNGKDDRNDFRMQARESRIFVKTKSQGGEATYSTHFEGDFFGNSEVGGGNGYETWSNSFGLRMRHAYGARTSGANTVLIGQSWSTFMDLPGLTPVMDFNGDLATTFVRQTQIRYTRAFGPGNNLSISLENPDRGLTATGPAPVFVNAGTARYNFPDLIAKYWYGSSWGHISPKILIRQFSLQDGDEDPEEAVAFCGSFTSHFNLGKHKLYFGGLYGNGMGRYGGLGNISGAGLTADGDIELVPFYGVYLGTRIQIAQKFAYILGLGYTETDKEAYEGDDAVLAGAANNVVRSLRTFVTYNPDAIMEYGFGVVYGDRETMDEGWGDGTRIQAYVKYNY